MVSLFADPRNLPIERIHTHHQYPYTVRVVSQWLVQSNMRLDVKESSTEKSFRKYFGKKVRNLICIQNNPSFNPGYRCKFLKTARLYTLPTVKYHFRQIENLHIADANFWISAHYQETHNRKGRPGFGKVITSHKYLKYLETDFGWLNIHLKPLRALTKLQVLSLTMNEDTFMKNYRFLINIKALKKLNLSVISTMGLGPSSGRKFSGFSHFLTDVTKLKKLDFLGLKLTDRLCPHSRSKLFESLSKIDIPAFSIELTEMKACCIDPHILGTCTKNIDLLELYFVKDVSVAVLCGEENILRNAKRKLKMSFEYRPPNMPTKSAQTQDLQIFKHLDLSSKLGILAEGCLGIRLYLPEVSNAKCIKTFSFNFSRTLEKMSEEIDQAVLAILQNESNLEHLQLKRETETCYTKLNVSHCFSIVTRTPAIQNLISLHLIDYSFKENFFEILSEVLGHLKNLKVLRLDLHTTDPIDDNVPAKHLLTIPENSKLIEVYLTLPHLKGNMIADFMTLILSLHELEELTLLSGSQLIETDKNRLVLLDGFKKLKKLRNVSILRGINGNKSSSFPFGVRNDHRNPIVDKVISELKELYDFNCSLWKFCIESNEPPYQIRYKRY